MRNRYFYSESPEPVFKHVIRCQCDDAHTHESGREWLLDMEKTIEVLGLVEGVDYERWRLGMFAFKTEETASEFYTFVSVDLGAAHRLMC